MSGREHKEWEETRGVDGALGVGGSTRNGRENEELEGVRRVGGSTRSGR